jgi:hypothetical protein
MASTILTTMWRKERFIQHTLLAVLLVSMGNAVFAPAQADTTAVPSLTISQLKITSSNGQFVTLYNPTASTLDMSKYQLEYFNSFDLTKATSSRLITLSGMLPPHGYFMINDGTLQLCYQLMVDSVSLGFSSVAGLVEVLALNQNTPGSSAAPSLQDYVGWSKTAAVGAQTLPTSTSGFLVRQPVDALNNPQISAAGSGTWQPVQPATGDACSLVSASVGDESSPVASGLDQLLPATEPPAAIISLAALNSSTTVALPADDVGLMTPQITELLPNPVGTGNDATDEYIELYNANDGTFDLSGFSLEAGLTTLHKYIFPDGSSLAPHSFTAFYSSATKLALSNSGSQVNLVDPLGNVIANTDQYGAAADGQAWALASGKWYWTTLPTPGAANLIEQPISKSASAAKSASKTSASKSKTSTKTSKTKKAKKLKATATAAKSTDVKEQTSVPIHSWELALVASLALLYGAYEYRKDLANYYRKLRANLTGGT